MQWQHFNLIPFSQVGPIDRNLATPVVGLDPLEGRLLMNIEQVLFEIGKL